MEATTATPVENVRRGDAVRFTPFTRRNRVCVVVDAVTTTPSGALVMVHGVRLNANGHVDSQSRPHAWPVESGAVVEVEVVE